MSSSFDQFDFVSDSRDGKKFEVIKNLENASARGSKLASEMLERLQFLTNSPDYPKPHSQIKVELEAFEKRWEVIRAFEEDGEGDEDEIEDKQDLVDEMIEWIVWLEAISAESCNFIFDKYINFEGYGAFGQGNDFSFDKDLAVLVTSPTMPRDLLWEISVGDSAQYIAGDWDGFGYNYPWRFIGSAPRYISNLAISPIASTNLLKEINQKYSDVIPNPFHFHTMVNVNADLWLLKSLDPEFVRDNLVYEIKLIETSDQITFNDELDDLHESVLNSYFATPPGIVEYNEAEYAWNNKFSDPFGIGALLIAIRMSEEFKAGNVKVNDHLESDSIILRTLLYYNPDLTNEHRDALQKQGIIELHADVAEMYKGAWSPDNPTIVT
jgi:hypothetical protein